MPIECICLSVQPEISFSGRDRKCASGANVPGPFLTHILNALGARRYVSIGIDRPSQVTRVKEQSPAARCGIQV